MFDALAYWLTHKWKLDVDAERLLSAYDTTFNNPGGQMVIQDLIDKFLMVDQVPQDEAARHLGRQDVVLAVLRNLDLVRNPQKYRPPVKGK